MVRGCQRRVVFIKNTDSKIFSEAYFILSDEAYKESHTDEDIIREANRIIDESVGIEEKAPFGKQIVTFLIGRGIPFAVGLAAGLLLGLIY